MRVILNPAPVQKIADEMMAMVDTVTPNETEAAALTGVEVVDLESAHRAARVLLNKGVRNVIITLGGNGVYCTDGTREELIERIPVNAVDTTGAGDAFNGGFATALSNGMELFDAVRYGNCTGRAFRHQAGYGQSHALQGGNRRALSGALRRMNSRFASKNKCAADRALAWVGGALVCGVNRAALTLSARPLSFPAIHVFDIVTVYRCAERLADKAAERRAGTDFHERIHAQTCQLTEGVFHHDGGNDLPLQQR